MPRKKATDTEPTEVVQENIEEKKETKQKTPEETEPTPETDTSAQDTVPDEASEQKPPIMDDSVEQSDEPTERQLNLGVLKINADEPEEQQDDENEIIWHELAVANRSRRIIPAVVTGLERTANLANVVIAYYKNQRIVVPLSEMMIDIESDKEHLKSTLTERLTRICNTMLGAEIDLMIKGMDKSSGSVVASRKDAMLRKRERFYLTKLSDGLPQIRAGRVVEARIISVTPMVARFDVFGIEVSLPASQLSWDWVSSVSDKFFVGEKMNLLITEVEGDNVDNLKIKVDAKSLIPNTSAENLKKCAVQGRYIGEITNVKNGIAYLRLKVGVNAIAHTNNDKRTPGKGDVVSFVITRINEDYGNVSGIITRIIKQVI